MKKIIEALNRFFNGLSMVALVLMMVLMSIDVVARYVFNQSISVVYTVTESYLMVIVVFLGMAYTHYNDDHIQFKLVTNVLSLKVRDALHVVTHLFALAFFAVIAYEGYLITKEAWISNASTGGLISLPLYLSYIWVPLASSLMVLISVLKIVESFVRLFSSSKQSEA